MKGGSDEVKRLREQILEGISKAEAILGRLPNPTKEAFKTFWKSEMDLSFSSKIDVFGYFKQLKEQFEKENRFGAAKNLRYAWYSLKGYKQWLKDGLSPEQREELKASNRKYVEPTVVLYFEDIDAAFLNSYANYMQVRGCSLTTIGIYLRTLKSLYNGLVKQGILPDKNNPFKQIKVGSTEKSKDVLYPDQIKALWEYQAETLREKRAKAFFFFCYLCNGMNFKDVAYLKYSNVRGNVLTFVRQKTKTTKKVTKEIKVYLHDEVHKIIAEWGTKNPKPYDHIFPMFNVCKDLKHLNETIVRYKRITNKSLNLIGRKLEFDVRVNLGLARHSFATKHKLDGTPVSFISDALGHSNTSTTEHYMKSLPDENLKRLSENLLSF